MRHMFSNNAATTLDGAITDSATSITLATGTGALFASPDALDSEVQMATLVAGADIEIVRITARAADVLTVERGREGTTAIAWADGSRIEARITADMLDRNLQNQDDSSGIAIGTYASGAMGNAWVIAGFPALQRPAAVSLGMDKHMTPDATGATFAVNLGVVPTWAASTSYVDGVAVKPTTPDGNQYIMRMRAPPFTDLTSGTVEPPFDDTFVAIDFDAADSVNKWYGVDLAAGFQQTVQSSAVRFYVTEVGFICLEFGASVSAPPSISIGTNGDDTRYMNNVALSAIDGSYQIHRVAVTDRRGVTNLRFKLDTAAVGDVFVGRFYYKGTFVEAP